MKEVDMYGDRWTNTESQYLLAMDSLKYVAARRQKILKDKGIKEYHNAPDYYKIWSWPG